MIKIAIAQINPTVGDLEGNTEKIIEYISLAKSKGANLVVFPELAITGYPPKDLLLKPSFIEDNQKKLDEIIENTHGIAAVVGFVDGLREIYNAAALIKDGELIGVQHKTHLPNYDVFDEKRYFTPAKTCRIFDVEGVKIGINICEDIWVEDGPPKIQSRLGAELLVTINASPFHAGKLKEREKLIAKRAKENWVPIIYCNMVGGQDDLVFDGGSYIFDREGRLIARCKRFEEDLLLWEPESKPEVIPEEDPMEEIFNALVLGIRDYARKNGFDKAIIGLSGGIDSSLTAALATKALGSENVIGLSMPSRITSNESMEDAMEVAKNLGIAYKVVPISEIMDAYTKALAEEFKGLPEDVTEENLQARIRGNLLLAFSNKFGYLVISTGNKSELAVGYTTLYGDMAGGLAAISDVPKTMVYELAKFINMKEGKELIPKRVIEKEPSAELRVGQKDADEIPPYEVLDPILHAYIEENKSKREIIAMGYDRKIVEDIIWRVDHNEYKRKQAPIGIKVTTKAFGFGRRMPITNKYGG